MNLKIGSSLTLSIKRLCKEANQMSSFHFQELAILEEERKKKKRFHQDKEALLRQIRKQIQKLQKKEERLTESLEQCRRWEEKYHEAELFKANFASIQKGESSIEVWDWLTDQKVFLILDPLKSPQEEMAKRFLQAQKLRRGQEPLLKQLEKTKKQREEKEERQKKMSGIETIEELHQWQTELMRPLLSSAHHQEGRTLVYREYQSAKGVKIWVGKNAKANDQLTFQLANGRDWWLHVKGIAGSHVLIRMFKDEHPDPETLQDAMLLALYYSKARSQGEGEVCWTQRKYVSRLGKYRKAGQVQISKQQTRWIRFDPIRYQALRNRL